MRKVIVVEDNPREADALEKLLVSVEENITVEKTGFAEQAYELAKKEKVCLFIIDLQLSDYSGLDLANKIRKLDKHEMTPILFITGNVDRELFSFKTYHCYDYIIKPYIDERVIDVVKTILSNTKDDDAVLECCSRPYIFIVKLKDILYAELLNRKVTVFTCNASHPVKGKTMTEVYKELGPDFIKVHSSFIVNTNHVIKRSYSKREIYIKGIKKPIPIGKAYMAKVKERFNELS